MAKSIRPLPDPFDRQSREILPEEGKLPNGAARLVPFDVAWNGPTDADLPAIPKPMATRTESTQPQKTIPPPVPKVSPLPMPEGVEGLLGFIAKGVAKIVSRPSTFITGNITCAVAGRGYQLPPFLVPLFKQAVVKAWFTNVGTIYVASRQSDAQNAAVGWPLIANEGIGYDIPDLSDIWVMATVAGEGGSFTVEQA